MRKAIVGEDLRGPRFGELVDQAFNLGELHNLTGQGSSIGEYD